MENDRERAAIVIADVAWGKRVCHRSDGRYRADVDMLRPLPGLCRVDIAPERRLANFNKKNVNRVVTALSFMKRRDYAELAARVGIKPASHRRRQTESSGDVSPDRKILQKESER